MGSTLIILSLIASIFNAVAEQDDIPNDRQIRSWVDELANGLPARRFETPNDRLTKQERESLKKVQTAYRQLTKHFILALPVLVEHLDDKRYSFPSEHPTSGVFQIQTVGDACHSIVQRKLLIRNPVFIDTRDIAVALEMPIDGEWYKRVSKMSLFAMQVDSIDWLLKQPKISRVSDEPWNEAMTKIREFRTDFVRKGEAEDSVFGPAIEGK